MIAVEPIIAVMPMKTTRDPKAAVSFKNRGNGDVEENKALQEQPHHYSLKNKIKLSYEYLKKSKAPTCFCILFYIFICIFGNVVTGIFILKHHVTEHEIQSEAKNINEKLPNSSCKGFCNISIDNSLFDDLITADDEDLSYLLAYDDLPLNMSHFDDFDVGVRNQLLYLIRMIRSLNTIFSNNQIIFRIQF